MKKTFAKFLLEKNRLDNLTKKYLKYSNMVLEQIKIVEPENNQTRLQNVKQVFDQIQDKQNTFVKVLKYEQNKFTTFNTKKEFSLNNNEHVEISLEYGNSNVNDFNDEKTVADLFNDITKMVNDNVIDIQNGQLKLQNGNVKLPTTLYYDDRSNMVFFVIGNGINQNVITAFINVLVEVAGRNHADLSHQNILNLIQQHNNDNIISGILKQMLNQTELAQIQQQNGNNQPPAQDDADAEIDNEQPEQNEQPVQQDQQQPQQQQQQNVINGFNYLGIANNLINLGDVQVILTMHENEEEFLRFIRQIQDSLRQVLIKNGNSIKWMKIDSTGKDATTAIKRIGFFTYNAQNQLQMFYMNMKKPLMVKLLNCPAKVINSLKADNAKKWSNIIWPHIFNGINNKNGTLEVVYDPQGWFRSKGINNQIPFVLDQNIKGDQQPQNQQQNQQQAVNQNGNKQDVEQNQVEPDKPKFNLDAKIINALEQRIKNALNINPRFKLAKNNFTTANHQIIIPGKNHRITDADIHNLASHFKDWHYGDRNWSAQQFWKDVMNTDKIDKSKLIDPDMFKVNRENTKDDELDEVQKKIDEQMKKINKFLTIDIVHGEYNKTDKIKDKDGIYFHIKIPGKNPQTLIDNDALTFLQTYTHGLDKKIMPIFDELKKQIKDLHLFISLDNKLTRI